MQNHRVHLIRRSGLALTAVFCALTFGSVIRADTTLSGSIDPVLAGNIPADDSIYSGEPNVFQWDRDAGNVTQYRLKVRTAKKNMIVNQPFDPDTICDVEVCQVDVGVTPGVRLKQDDVYTWRLVATIDGTTTPSPWLRFTNRVLPVDFELIDPHGNFLYNDSRPVFSWPYDENVTTYRVKLWNNLSDKVYHNTELDAADICSSDEMVCSAEYILISGKEEIDNGTFYQWQVTASNPQVRGKAKSLIAGFKIQFPGRSTLIDPINNKVVNSTTPEFTWSSVPLATEYRLTLYVITAENKIWISDWMSSGSDGLLCDDSICTFTPETPLPLVNGKTHLWRVWTRNVPVSKNISHTYTEKFKVDLSGGLNALRH